MVAWFEIPVADMQRAKKFYDSVFGISITIHDMGNLVMGWFPTNKEQTGATGSLVQHDMYSPSATAGALLYFSCDDIAATLERVVHANGEILKPKTEIGAGHGFMALMKDTEGNRIALHSQR